MQPDGESFNNSEQHTSNPFMVTKLKNGTILQLTLFLSALSSMTCC
jgi:hypothetical protein